MTDAECAELTAWIKEAKSQRRKQIDDSIGEMLNHLPRLVRMPARKILFD
ncbi:hypothetical protein [Antrihabitans stalactiti]|nr:hypothetical protein [Antrihabitans stalactiti]